MKDNSKSLNFSGFGIIANSIGPVPESFLIKEIANHNTPIFSNSFNSNNTDRNKTWYQNNNCFTHLWNYDNNYDDYDEEDDYNEGDEE